MTSGEERLLELPKDYVQTLVAQWLSGSHAGDGL
jgi:hypothetical protein